MLANKNEGTLRATSACQQKKHVHIDTPHSRTFVPTCALTPDLVRRVAHLHVARILSPFVNVSQTE